MYITKVKLKDKGLSGAEIEYITKEERSSRFADVPITKEPPHPVHQDLEDLFKSLRVHILELHHMIPPKLDKGEKDSIIADTEVICVEYTGGTITLKGEFQSFGDKVLKLKTVTEEHDEYSNWEGLKILVENIQRETKEYLNGTKKIKDEELLLKWTRAKKKEHIINEDNIKTFSQGEIDQMLDGIVNEHKLVVPAMTDYNDELQIPPDQIIEITPNNLDPNPRRAKKNKDKVKVIETSPAGGMYIKNQEEEDF